MNIKDDASRKKCLLLHYIGEEAADIYYDLPEPTAAELPEGPTEYDNAKAKFNKRFTKFQVFLQVNNQKQMY